MKIGSSRAARLAALIVVAVCALLFFRLECAPHDHAAASGAQPPAAAAQPAPSIDDSGCCDTHVPISHSHKPLHALPSVPTHRGTLSGLLLALAFAVGFLAIGAFDPFRTRASFWSQTHSSPPDPLWGRSLLLRFSKARC